jgi:hypothetical protein
MTEWRREAAIRNPTYTCQLLEAHKISGKSPFLIGRRDQPLPQSAVKFMPRRVSHEPFHASTCLGEGNLAQTVDKITHPAVPAI